MRVGLFIPCFIDQCYPQVGMATVAVLRHFGVEPHYPTEQTCCGQPMANVGLIDTAKPLARSFANTFAEYDYVVAPSGSCVSMVRNHYGNLLNENTQETEQRERLQSRTFELCEFLHDVLEVRQLPGKLTAKVGLHHGCHGLRELELGTASELNKPFQNKTASLIASIDGVTLAELSRSDECCGFGGTFAVSEEAVSCMMGRDRVRDHQQAGAELIASGDMSCLMHLDGLVRRDGTPLKTLHVAELMSQALCNSVP